VYRTLLVALAFGCAATPVDLDAGRLVVEADGRDVPLEFGLQGGFHVLLEVGLEGAEVAWSERHPLLEVDARRAGVTIASLTMTPRFVAGAPGTYRAHAAVPLALCPSAPGVRVVDEPTEVWLRAVDEESGAVVERTVRITPRCPEGDRDYCHEVCSG